MIMVGDVVKAWGRDNEDPDTATDEESVPKVTLAQLKDFHAKAYAAGNAVISVVGDLTRA